MALRAICIGLLLSSLPIAGCGTVENLIKPVSVGCGPTPFGGVRQDVCRMKMAANGELGFKGPVKSESEQQPQVALMMLCAADLPFSLIGDALTWPYTASYTFINQPVPVPPVLPAPPVGQPQTLLAPEYKEPEMKATNKDYEKPGLLPTPQVDPKERKP